MCAEEPGGSGSPSSGSRVPSFFSATRCISGRAHRPENGTQIRPTETPRPESFGEATTKLQLAGLELTAHVLGPGCSDAHVVVSWEGHVFVGDLVANGAHSWLEIGRTDAWLERLGEIEAMAPRQVHPGRGRSGGAALLTAEREYLQAVIDLVAAEKPTMPPDLAGLSRVRQALERRYPNHRFPVFLEIGLPAEWERQAKAAGT